MNTLVEYLELRIYAKANITVRYDSIHLCMNNVGQRREESGIKMQSCAGVIVPRVHTHTDTQAHTHTNMHSNTLLTIFPLPLVLMMV